MPTPELGQELLAVVARLNRWATRHAAFDVSPAQARLLGQLEESGPARIGDLAKAAHCSQPTMTTQVQGLEAQGWTTRRTDPVDARATLVELHPFGREALAHVRRARSEVVAPLLAALDDAERQSLGTVLTALSRVLDAQTTPLPTSPTPVKES